MYHSAVVEKNLLLYPFPGELRLSSRLAVVMVAQVVDRTLAIAERSLQGTR